MGSKNPVGFANLHGNGEHEQSECRQHHQPDRQSDVSRADEHGTGGPISMRSRAIAGLSARRPNLRSSSQWNMVTVTEIITNNQKRRHRNPAARITRLVVSGLPHHATQFGDDGPKS
ncbi:MAG: hypothetical protein GY742_15435 [Hyphomicrobiales bacterium]|nr:hypothetical protein [Hyphomicrobiales bacterium]